MRLRLLALFVFAATCAHLAAAAASPPIKPPAAKPADAATTFGSTRNARVALPISPTLAPSDRPRLTFLATDMPAADLAALQAASPNVRIVAGLTRETALAQAATAHAADARLLTPAFLERARNLVWAHSPGAGVEWLMGLEGLLKAERIVLTNSRAVHGPAIADHAMAMLLTLTRNLRHYQHLQTQARWLRDPPNPPSVALQGRTLLIVGIGGIGSEIGQRAHAFGMRVIATRRTDTPAPAYVEKVGKPQELLTLLPEADVVAICTPLTTETERMFNAQAFAAMKQGSILINIARGRIVDTDALLAALKGGRLGGAGLDVTDPEPLPSSHPLWRVPNVLITPHVSSDAEVTGERARSLLVENVRRFGSGAPLLNVVDKTAGY